MAARFISFIPVTSSLFVKTTSAKKYFVRPKAGVIQPSVPVSSEAVQPLKDGKEAAVQQTLQQEMAVQYLKNERDAAARQLEQLQLELEFLKSRRRRMKLWGCFLTFSELKRVNMG